MFFLGNIYNYVIEWVKTQSKLTTHEVHLLQIHTKEYILSQSHNYFIDDSNRIILLKSKD